jgi:hypothetical protein
MNVVHVNNAVVREHLENFTALYCFPHIIVFVLDGSTRWVTSIESVQDAKLNTTKADLRQYLADNGLNVNLSTAREVLETYGTLIEYTPA